MRCLMLTKCLGNVNGAVTLQKTSINRAELKSEQNHPQYDGCQQPAAAVHGCGSSRASCSHQYSLSSVWETSWAACSQRTDSMMCGCCRRRSNTFICGSCADPPVLSSQVKVSVKGRNEEKCDVSLSHNQLSHAGYLNIRLVLFCCSASFLCCNVAELLKRK